MLRVLVVSILMGLRLVLMTPFVILAYDYLVQMGLINGLWSRALKL